MEQRIIDLFDEYTHQPLTREEFLRRLTHITGSMAAALALLPMLEAQYAHAATVPETDPAIITEEPGFPAGGVTMTGYLARPAAPGRRGAVLVIHENRGLNPHIRDVVRRVARAGYLGMAPDALSPLGGTPADEDRAREMIGSLVPEETTRRFTDALAYLRGRPECNGKSGCVGFCWGGGLAGQLAVRDPELRVSVSFYGRQPDAAEVPRIRAFVQLHYGELDKRINAGIPAYEAALKAAGIPYELYVYKGANHAFHNDSSPSRYQPEAARLAWERTLQAFADHLR